MPTCATSQTDQQTQGLASAGQAGTADQLAYPPRRRPVGVGTEGGTTRRGDHEQTHTILYSLLHGDGQGRSRSVEDVSDDQVWRDGRAEALERALGTGHVGHAEDDVTDVGVGQADHGIGEDLECPLHRRILLLELQSIALQRIG